MKRRSFIKNTAIVSISSLLLPDALLANYKKYTSTKSNFNGSVLIIGAGVAGLYAAKLLKEKNINFKILEASSVYGGRVAKLNGFAKFQIDLGAQWLHGKNNIVADLVRRNKIKITKDNSDEYYWFKQQIVSKLPKDIQALFYREEALPDVSFKDFALQNGFGDAYNNIVESIAGDSGADADKISAYWKIKEEENWESGENDYKFQETYFDLIDEHIAKDIKQNIKLNCPVKSINYSSDKIEIKDKAGNTFSADKVIVTVPISILKAGDLEFQPPLTPKKTEAFSKIGMGPGLKVFLKFSHKFYQQNTFGGNICASYIDDSIGKKQDDNVLMAFIMGHQAENLSALQNDDAIKNMLIQELDTMCNGQASTSFLDFHVQDFGKMPYIKGAYSFSTVGMGNAREIAAESIENKLFFAGEAMNTNGHHQTVQGAIETGYNVVNKILDI